MSPQLLARLEPELRAYLLTELAPGAHRLDCDTPLFESVLDSTSILALVAWIEEHYQIEIHDSEIVPSNFSSLRRLADFLARRLAPAPDPDLAACHPLAASG